MSCTYVPQLQKSEVVRWGTFSILVDLTQNDPSRVKLHWFAVPLVWCICRLGCILLFLLFLFLSFFVLLYADKRVHIHTILTFVLSISSLSVRVQLWEQHTRDAILFRYGSSHTIELRYLHVIQQTENKLHHYTADMNIYIWATFTANCYV